MIRRATLRFAFQRVDACFHLDHKLLKSLLTAIKNTAAASMILRPAISPFERIRHYVKSRYTRGG
jgi:hypothetical protein